MKQPLCVRWHEGWETQSTLRSNSVSETLQLLLIIDFHTEFFFSNFVTTGYFLNVE